MEQHPIPQAITAYKFKLVGDMTLKQFLELAAGVVSAWVLFNSPANFLLKWTLGPFLAFFGFALAFMPIEDRPLDQWIINFVKAIYSPTQFIYRPKAKKLDFLESVKKAANKSGPSLRQGYGGQSQLHDYLESLPQSSTSAFDQAEAKYLEHIGNLFSALGNKLLPVTGVKTQVNRPLKTSLKGVRVRALSHPQACLLPRATVYQAPEESKVAAMPLVQKAQTTQKISVTEKPVIQTVKPTPIAPKPQPEPVKPKQQSTPPVFATDVVLPQRPERPNLIAGITLDKDGRIIPGVILEIRDSQGFPVRALKSNKLGQFFIATSLDDGIYEISAEHDGYKFAIIKLEAKNEIIPPLKIQAVA